jgi:hypothetical protein
MSDLRARRGHRRGGGRERRGGGPTRYDQIVDSANFFYTAQQQSFAPTPPHLASYIQQSPLQPITIFPNFDPSQIQLPVISNFPVTMPSDPTMLRRTTHPQHHHHQLGFASSHSQQQQQPLLQLPSANADTMQMHEGAQLASNYSSGATTEQQTFHSPSTSTHSSPRVMYSPLPGGRGIVTLSPTLVTSLTSSPGSARGRKISHFWEQQSQINNIPVYPQDEEEQQQSEVEHKEQEENSEQQDGEGTQAEAGAGESTAASSAEQSQQQSIGASEPGAHAD